MSLAREFTIDFNESFPHLDHAPIVEAVIHWRARAEKTLEPEKLLQELKDRLPEYPITRSQQKVQLETQISPSGSSQAQRATWLGFRFESENRRHIAQFTRDGFVFSRVTPYVDWEHFEDEAKRLWKIHVEHTEPLEIERLGVRFINRLVPVELDRLDEILTLPPRPPDSLPLPIGEFLHRSQFAVPGSPYRINVIQTNQPPAPPETDAVGLILDIDVFTTTTTLPEEVDKRLKEMRWLKNKAFYSLLTPETVKRLQENSV